MDDAMDTDMMIDGEPGKDAAGAGVEGDGIECLSSGALYEMILKHPTYRVVEASDTPGSCHPLDLSFDGKQLRFKHDGAASQNHPNGMCADIITLYGPDPLSEESYAMPVLVQEFFADSWDGDMVHPCKRASIDAKASWIRLHPLR